MREVPKTMKRTVTTAFLAAMLIGPQAAAFSGERELEITASSIETFPTFSLGDLARLGTSARYIGSVGEWHIFGEHLVSDEGGMPFSSVYGYKVPASILSAQGGRTIDLTKSYYAFVQNCSSFTVRPVECGRARMTVDKGARCLYPKDGD